MSSPQIDHDIQSNRVGSDCTKYKKWCHTQKKHLATVNFFACNKEKIFYLHARNLGCQGQVCSALQRFITFDQMPILHT
jgi:hypothetical protein